MKSIAKVISNNLISSNIGIMKFKLKEKIDFLPGQFCNIKIPNKPLIRPYSMTSVPEEDFEFYIKSYEDGHVAKHILALKDGDEVHIIGANGKFTLKDTDKEIYFISAGSGVAPNICMARCLKGSKRKITFLQGASYVEELGFEKELKEMSENPNFTYVPTISRPRENTEWNGKTGRVEDHLKICSNKDAEVYICGPPPMVKKVKEKLKEKEFPEENILIEQYY